MYLSLRAAWLLCVALALLLGAWTTAVSAANAPFACGRQPIRLAYYEFGYFYFAPGKGIDKDIVDELGLRSGCRFETQVMARARIWVDLASGDLDMSVSGIPNSERDKFAWFAIYLTMKNYTLLSRSVAEKVRRPEDFVNHSDWQFGVVRAFRHGEAQDRWLAPLRQAGRVQESPNVESVFRKLKEGRIEAMYSQAPVYRKLLADLGMENGVAVQDWAPADKGTPHGLILAKSRFSEAESRYWQRLIKEMRMDGTLRRIYRRYLPEEDVARMLDF